MTITGGTHELIDSKTAAKNPFPLKIHEMIPGLLIGGPSWGTLERLECGEPISKFCALQFECSNFFRGIGTSWRVRDLAQERGEDCGGIERCAYGLGGT